MPSELKKPEPFDLAQLRHLYAQMVGGHIKDSAQAKRIAEGILGRAIEGLERRERQLEQYAADRVREAVEAIADEYASRLQSDLEHGVRSINERYARNFNQSYPLLAGFMGWLNDRTLKEQTK